MTIRGPFAFLLVLVLLLSLAGNLLIAGFVGGRAFGPRGPGGPANEIERIAAIGPRTFPSEIRDQIERAAAAQRDAMHARFDAVQEARDRMFAAMRADPFDPAALAAANADLRAATTALQEAGQEIILKAISDAPPAVRAKIRSSRGPGPGGPRGPGPF